MTLIAFSGNRHPDPFSTVHRELDELRAKYIDLLRECSALRAKVDNRKKLTGIEVARIRAFARDGKSQAWIAEVFDLNSATVSRIVRGIYHAA